MGDVTIGVGKPGIRSLFGWAADFTGCGYYRIAVPLTALLAQGWRINGHSDIAPEHYLFDAVVAQRTCKPGPTRLLEVMKNAGMPIIMEIDDDLFHIDPNNVVAHQFYDADHLKRLASNLRLASAVTVSTTTLREEMLKYNHNVRVFPNYLDEAIFDIRTSPSPALTIGWAGSTSHASDFDVVRPAIEQVVNGNGVVFKCIGGDYGSTMNLESGKYSFQPWLSTVPEYYEHLNFDIGIAPLAANKFNESKSHLKALEYGAMGIPVVASKFGPYIDYVRHGETGFLAKKHADWVKYLTMLIKEPDMRREMGENARMVAREHTIQKHIEKRVTFYDDIISERTELNVDVAERIKANL